MEGFLCYYLFGFYGLITKIFTRSVSLGKYIAIFLSLFSFNSFAEDKPLTTPTCLPEAVLTTPITLFLTESIKAQYAPFVIEGHIKSWLEHSNTVMRNSCIPMKRTLKEVVYISELLDINFQDIYAVHDLLAYYYPDRIKSLQQNQSHHHVYPYYGVVFSTRNSTFNPDKCGQTDVTLYPQFFVLDINCPKTVLEHELGHLAWANHDIDTLSDQTEGYLFDLATWLPVGLHSKIKQYAYGYRCGGKGTVMSYADELHPFYSSPSIAFDGIACGNDVYADNARVLREYAEAKLEITN